MTKLTKILFVVPFLGTRGTDRQLFELLRGLNDQTFDLHVVTLTDRAGGFTERVQSLGIPVTCLNSQGRMQSLRSIAKVSGLIKTHNVDIVHGFLDSGSWVASVAGRICGVKVVASSIRDARDSDWSSKAYRAMTSRLAHLFISNSRAGFDNRYAHWKSHFKVVYNGIDTERFSARHAMQETYRKEFALSPDQHCVAMVAELSELKDYRTYIDVAARLNQVRDDLVFLSVGDGPHQQEIFRYADSKGNPVTFLGARNDVDMLWSVIDISVLLTNTALIEEGLPNAVLESLACGVPAIANNKGGTVEIIDHEQNGYLLDSADPQLIATVIAAWLDDKELYTRLSQAAAEKIKRSFSYESYVETYRSLYKKLHLSS